MSKTTPKAGIAPIKKKVVVSKKPVQKKKVSKQPKIELISFSVKATIPTQQYGNFQPEIILWAPTIEIARDTVMPIMESLYQTYAEFPSNGRLPSWFNKASVTVTEKNVDVKELPDPEKSNIINPNEKPSNSPDSSAPSAPSKPVETNDESSDGQSTPKSEAYIKAENAIASAVSTEALGLVEDKIRNSVKITGVEKQMLFTVLLKKRNDVKK